MGLVLKYSQQDWEWIYKSFLVTGSNYKRTAKTFRLKPKELAIGIKLAQSSLRAKGFEYKVLNLDRVRVVKAKVRS